ncbi:MAG: hypothetical protein HQK50_01440 [Oligoflexia bacterium]|nr:hypothetical protein [Oligoflexia bacterium]
MYALLFFVITLVNATLVCAQPGEYLSESEIESITLLGNHNTPQELLVTHTSNNGKFIQRLAKVIETINKKEALKGAGNYTKISLRIINATEESLARLNLSQNPYICPASHQLSCNEDQWVRDVCKIASMTFKGTKQVKRLIIDTNRGRGTKELPLQLTTIWTDTVAVKPIHSAKESEAGDYGGNIEVTPNDILYTGSNLSQEMQDFFQSKGYRDRMILFNNDWLDVGHVDEQISVVSIPNDPCGMAIIKASPKLAIRILAAANTDIFQSIPDSYHSRPAFLNIESLRLFVKMYYQETIELLKNKSPIVSPNDHFFSKKESYQVIIQNQIIIDNIINKNVGLLKKKIKQFNPECKKIKTISLPVLFNCRRTENTLVEGPTPTNCLAELPNSVNMSVLGDHLLVPDPIYSPFRSFIKKKLQQINKSPYFLKDYNCYHVLDGEIHCGTNELRVNSTVNKSSDGTTAISAATQIEGTINLQ